MKLKYLCFLTLFSTLVYTYGQPSTNIYLRDMNISLTNTANLKPTQAITVETVIKNGYTSFESLAMDSGYLYPITNIDPTESAPKGYELKLGGVSGGGLLITSKLTVGNASNPVTLNAAGSIPLDAQWHHVAFTYDGRYLKLYVDGQLQNSTDAGANHPIIYNNSNTMINNGLGQSYIDEIRLWNVAKSQEQLQSYKDCELNGNESNLLAYYKFSEGNDGDNTNTITEILDSSGNNNTGTVATYSYIVWKSGNAMFSPPETNTTLYYTLNQEVQALTAYSTCPDATGLLWYTTATGGIGSSTAITPSTESLGTTSYWVASTYANHESERVKITVSVLPPASNTCNGAPELTVGSKFNDHLMGIDLSNATDSGFENTGCSLGYSDKDVWAKFTVPSSGQFFIESSDVKARFFLYKGNDCNDLELLECENSSLIHKTGLTPGETIYVRTWERYKFNSNLNYAISVYDTNYTICNSTSNLQIGTSFNQNAKNVDLTGATNSNVVPLPDCSEFRGGDAWFLVEADESGRLILAVDNDNAGLAAYSGSCNNALSYLGCANEDTNRLELVNLKAYTIIYVRVWQKNTNVPDISFKVAAYNPVYNVCDATSLTMGTSFNDYPETVDLTNATNSEVIPSPNCGYYNNDGDQWFSTIVPESGRFVVELNKTNEDDNFQGVALAAYTGNCNNDLKLLTCTEETTIDGVLARLEVLNATAGETIYLRTWRKHETLPINYKISAYQPTNTVCSDTETLRLTVGATFNDFKTPVDLTGATHSNVIPSPECNYLGGDKWFSVEVPQSGRLVVETGGETPNYTGLAAYKGTCNNDFEILECIEINPISVDYNYSRLELENLTPGDILYLRTWELYESSSTISYYISAYDPVVNVCSAPALNVGKTFQNHAVTIDFSEATYSYAFLPKCGVDEWYDFTPKDLWFTAVIPPSGNLTIETRGDYDKNNTLLSAYSGNCNNDLTLIACNVDINQDSMYSLASLSGLTPGNTIYIRVFGIDDDTYESTLQPFQLAAYDESAVLSNTQFSIQELKIYPNPSTGIFTINTQDELQIQVYNLLGKLITRKTLLMGNTNLDLSNFSNGLYILKTSHKNGQVNTYKLIKQ